ncbi:hypothetical protein BsBEST3102_19290 [Bacillus subtilis]|nr:hypothetical protein NBRC13719_19570 [Bacillus subtilis subsp. subtilis]BCV79369.1 hypothetical protein BsBEST3102_19290 [Bacillus subtilis]BCV83603.1 hypothetical protein BsBEST3106_19310 [Bacillus subtilis]BCV87837.1 hypothetical protein BsBEST3109_19330 [Bacillus subtilis]BCV92069.1 hypothetical protein BsBEST3125_19320 [Bacillus subtilis]
MHKIKKTEVLPTPRLCTKSCPSKGLLDVVLGRPIPSGSEAQGRSIFSIYVNRAIINDPIASISINAWNVDIASPLSLGDEQDSLE